jgi:hypothetical protein
MQLEKINQPATINTKAIICGMVLLFIALQVGFHPTYIQYFPTFKKFTWLHHIHGALMASWVILLVVQPMLIHKGKFAAHRFIGKISYVIGPLMIVSMFLVLRFTYHKYLLESPVEAVMSNQGPIIMQLLCFTVLYALAVIYRKHTFYHMRFMIGTALLMIIPIVGRIFFEYFGAEFWYDLYLSAGISSFLLMQDIRRKKDWKPYAIVTAAIISIILVYHARNTEAWAAIGRVVVLTFY